MVARLYVGNIPYGVTEEKLRKLFGEAGSVRAVALPIDRLTGRPRGFAFVEMASEAEAREAIRQLDGHLLDGRRLRVNRAEERMERRPPFRRQPEPALRGERPARGGGRSERKPAR